MSFAQPQPQQHLISISRVETRGGVEVSHLRLRGAVRSATVDDFESRLAQAGDRAGYLVVDLGETDYVDAEGLALMLAQHRRQTRRGGWLRVAAPSPAVRMILELSGVEDTLATYPTAEAAVSDLGVQAA